METIIILEDECLTKELELLKSGLKEALLIKDGEINLFLFWNFGMNDNIKFN